MTPERYLSLLAADGEALAAAAAGHLEADVPSCPGWSGADLLRHTGAVHREKTAVIRHGGRDRPRQLWWRPAPEQGEDLLEWYRDGLAELLNVLDGDPDRPAYSWAGDHRVAFWQRRMAQETLVHRWDAQAAGGRTQPLDAELAADGVDEYLRVFLPATAQPYDGPSGTLAVVRDDGPERWSLSVSAPRPVVRPFQPESPVDATISGAAEGLLLALWRRLPLTAVGVAGDRYLAEAVLDWVDLT